MNTKLAPAPAESRPQRARIPRGPAAAARRPAPADERALAFLEDVLNGEMRWQLADVQRLAAMHTLAAIGHWHAEGLDGPSGTEPG